MPEQYSTKADMIAYLIDLANRYRWAALTAPSAWQRRAADRAADAAMERAKAVAAW